MTPNETQTTQSLQMVAIYATAAIEQGNGEKCVVSLRQVALTRDSQPLYEFQVEMPDLKALIDGVAHQRVRVEPTKFMAIVRGLKRANARAYTATELLRNGGGA